MFGCGRTEELAEDPAANEVASDSAGLTTPPSGTDFRYEGQISLKNGAHCLAFPPLLSGALAETCYARETSLAHYRMGDGAHNLCKKNTMYWGQVWNDIFGEEGWVANCFTGQAFEPVILAACRTKTECSSKIVGPSRGRFVVETNGVIASSTNRTQKLTHLGGSTGVGIDLQGATGNPDQSWEIITPLSNITAPCELEVLSDYMQCVSWWGHSSVCWPSKESSIQKCKNGTAQVFRTRGPSGYHYETRVYPQSGPMAHVVEDTYHFAAKKPTSGWALRRCMVSNPFVRGIDKLQRESCDVSPNSGPMFSQSGFSYPSGRAVYRCFGPKDLDYFTSRDSNCERNGSGVLIGYTSN